MSDSIQPLTESAAKTVIAKAPATAPTINGGQTFLALWTLLTTNSAFLLDPASAAFDADVAAHVAVGTSPVKFTPDPSDKVTDWADLISALIAKLPSPTTNPDSGHFTKARISNLLTEVLSTTCLMYSDGRKGPTYAEALSNATAVFQAIAPSYVSEWPDACPATMSEALGM